MITFLVAFAMWAVSAAALMAFLAAGRRRRDRQANDRTLALAVRLAARHTPAWARTDHHRNDHGRHRR